MEVSTVARAHALTCALETVGVAWWLGLLLFVLPHFPAFAVVGFFLVPLTGFTIFGALRELGLAVEAYREGR